MIVDLDTMSRWLAAPAWHVAEARPSRMRRHYHEKTTARAGRRHRASRRARVVSPGRERLADSAARRLHRCERNDVRRPPKPARRHPAARKRPTDRPATTHRSPAETRYKKFNKYFMREIL